MTTAEDAADATPQRVAPNLDRIFGAAGSAGLMGFVTLETPEWLRARDAVDVRDDDLVFGVVTDDAEHCVPFYVVDYYHTVNTHFADVPVALVSCDRCGSSGAWIARAPDGRALTFSNWGILQAQLVWRDHETESVWLHSEATAIHGELDGVALDPLGLVLVQTFAEWRARYPDSLVLAEVTHDHAHRDMRHGHGREEVFERPGIGLHERDHFFASLEGEWDQRRPEQEMVLGISEPAGRRAYPWREVKHEGGVVHDDLGGAPIVVWCDPAPAGAACAAFDRTVDGQVLEFDVDAGRFVDRTTGSRWDLDGRCVEGPMVGRRLRPLRACFKRWFSWCASNPGAPLFESSRRGARDDGWHIDLAELSPVVDALTAAGVDAAPREEVVQAALPQGCRRGVLLDLDGDPWWLWLCDSVAEARDLATFARELVTSPRAIAHGSLVLEDASMERFAEWTHTHLRPDEEVPWSPAMDAEDRRVAFRDACEAFAAAHPSRGRVGAVSDLLTGLAAGGYEVDPARTRLLPPASRPVGCEMAVEVYRDGDRLIVARWETAAAAVAGAERWGHSVVAGAFVVRSTPVNMYRLRAMEMMLRAERNTKWSPLLEDVAFATAFGDAVRAAVESD